MAVRIILDIDVTNPEDVIKAHKGQLMGLLTDVVLSKERKKKRVNNIVAEEIVAKVNEVLPIELKKEMVEANYTVRVEEIDSISESSS